MKPMSDVSRRNDYGCVSYTWTQTWSRPKTKNRQKCDSRPHPYKYWNLFSPIPHDILANIHKIWKKSCFRKNCSATVIYIYQFVCIIIKNNISGWFHRQKLQSLRLAPIIFRFLNMICSPSYDDIQLDGILDTGKNKFTELFIIHYNVFL